MPDDPNLHDDLSSTLQSAVDRKMAADEHVLMTISGAHGEGLVVTGLRVMILREQMPIVGSDTEVDCFDYAYEQIKTVLVEDAAGGGYLKLQLFVPPSDDKRVNIYFSSYDQSKFTAAAARIRILVEQTREGAMNTAVAAAQGLTMCPDCGAQVQD
ncbi:MAG: hypothetical protein K8E24_014915, partial [Methanobacterium paludis]|nr:hypothetical protein [Methanobacterium paludis]